MPAKEGKKPGDKAGSKPEPARPAAETPDFLTQPPSYSSPALPQRLEHDPRSLSSGEVLRLQRLLGNNTVGQLLSGAQQHSQIQAKLAAGAAHGPLGQEADWVAEQRLNPPAPPSIQRATAEDERQAQPSAAQAAAESLTVLPAKIFKAGADRLGGSSQVSQAAPTAPGLIQRTAYANPRDPAIAALMVAANIADFGPYEWNDDNDKAPMFKLRAGVAWTLADCVNRRIYEPEDPAKAVAGEKGKNSLVQNRVRTARQAIFGKAQGFVDKIMEHDEGRTPRAITSLAAEDAWSGGHTAERHILGQGDMPGHRQVALRAAFWKVNGKKMDLDDAGTASVFVDDATGLNAVKAAVAAELQANWAVHRMTLAKGTQVKITYPGAVATVSYTKRDAPLGQPYAEAEMPQYIDPAKAGDRELYAGDYGGAGRPGDPHGPDPAKPTLTVGGAGPRPSVYLIVDPNLNADGGWAIYTAYPK